MNENINETKASHLFQIEDKMFKGIMIFNIIRMLLSIGYGILSFHNILLIMQNGYLLYGLLSIVSIVLMTGILVTTVLLKKQILTLQGVLIVLTVIMVCYNVTLGYQLQIPFMDAAMTYVIFKYKDYFMN